VNLVDTFAEGYPFGLDRFQRAGIGALAEDRSVLVAAPTGAGKTVVGEFAVFQALQRGGKCFYTTPIKALSNQKFADFVERYGPERVGLLTGDNVVNGEAPIVVMTTEVLRNMLYEGSRTLVGLQAVVLDEVHYLADRERGAVWEEVIINLPPSVQLACLSATVSNAEEFGAWLARVRSDPDGRSQGGDRVVRDGCDVVISELRPVPLEHSYAVNDRLYPTFAKGGAKGGRKPPPDAVAAARRAVGGVPNPDVLMLERRAGTANRVSSRGRRYVDRGAQLRAPRRSDLIPELAGRGWLPAIVFIFSRDGCQDAVRQLMEAGIRLTGAQEQAEIRALVDERTAALPPEDLEVLGYGPWAAALEHGIAAHHAGMVPVFKETVEELFVRGLLKVCFATETLALGINMPARTVVIERLEKWNGVRHELLTPGQFTQLTGRAGRRGLDDVGHAVVLHQRDVDFATVASLVSRRVDPLHSSFAPSYNMVVNLLRRASRAEAEQLLARSFAQFEADATVAGDEARIARNRDALGGYEQRLHSERGDFPGYWALRRELSQLESAGARDRRRQARDALTEAIAALQPGDVVALPTGGEHPDLAAIVGRSTSGSGAPLASAVTRDRKLVRLGPREFLVPPRKVGRIPLPRSGGPRQADYRKAVANALRGLPSPEGPGTVDMDDGDGDEPGRRRIAELRADLRASPVHGDPGLAELETWARRTDDLRSETERLERGVRRRTGSLVRQFERIQGVLSELGYLTDDVERPSPTPAGRMLAGLYSETDLVLAETLRRGLLDDLDIPGLAAVASSFVYETRLRDPEPPVLPTAGVRDALEGVLGVWREVAAREEQAALPVTRAPDAGFAEVAWRWAGGADLEEALGDAEMTAGDFVRATKQVADLLRQIRDASAADPALRPLGDRAHEASRALVRGVVAYTGME
jgi:ATP-dependent RNA helicase HelY